MQVVIKTIVALLLIIMFMTLGIWQMQRGHFKRNIENALHQNPDAISSAISLPFEDTTKWRYKHIALVGSYDSSKQFLLDNQVRDQRPGYNVFTPFYVPGSNAWLLVDRGWVPQLDKREKLPSVPADESQIRITGTVYVPYQSAFHLGGIADGEDQSWPRRIQYIDYDEISLRFGQTLQPFTLRLSNDEVNGYRRDWQNTLMPASKHYAYAFQWFALAAAVFGLWFLYVVRTRQNNNANG